MGDFTDTLEFTGIGIIGEPNAIMEHEVIGAFTGMLNSSSMKNSS